MKNRSPGIDLVRILGLMLVAAGHLWGDSYEVTRIAAHSLAVPLYFFLTGYFWRDGRSVASEASSRAKRLLVPYAVFTVVIGIPFFVLFAVRNGNPMPGIIDTIWGGSHSTNVFSPYWFLPVLFASAVLFRMLERWPRWATWLLVLAALVTCLLFGTELAEVPLDLFFAVPCLVFTLVGQWVRGYAPRLSHPVATGVMALLVGIALFASKVATPPDLKFGDFGTPVLTVAGSLALCIGLVLILTTALDDRPRAWAPLAHELALVSVVVLLAHGAAYFLLNPLGLPLPLVYLIALTGCWIVGVVLHRTRLSPYFVGVPEKKPPVATPNRSA